MSNDNDNNNGIAEIIELDDSFPTGKSGNNKDRKMQDSASSSSKIKYFLDNDDRHGEEGSGGEDGVHNGFVDDDDDDDDVDGRGVGHDDDDDDNDGGEDDDEFSDVLQTKLEISADLLDRVKREITSPIMSAVISGNLDVLEKLLMSGQFCPMTQFKQTYSLACGYHIEHLALQMTDMLLDAVKACNGDREQPFPPCVSCREKQRAQQKPEQMFNSNKSELGANQASQANQVSGGRGGRGRGGGARRGAR